MSETSVAMRRAESLFLGPPGRSEPALDLIERDPSSYRIEALTAYRHVDLLAEQARKFDAQFVAIGDYDKYADLKKAISGSNMK